MMGEVDFRVDAYEEAVRCLLYVQQCKLEQPEFWANLLGGIANGVMACLPDTVAYGVAERRGRENAKRANLQRAIQEKIDRKLNAKIAKAH
jgi:hypothetical protein